MEQAIKKAIEGGWRPAEYRERVFLKTRGHRCWGKHMTSSLSASISMSEILLDPTFWQALGKAERWDRKTVIRRGTVLGNFCAPPNSGIRGECFEEMGFNMDYIPLWNYHWHRFLDALAAGKTADQFFDELLNGTGLIQ